MVNTSCLFRFQYLSRTFRLLAFRAVFMINSYSLVSVQRTKNFTCNVQDYHLERYYPIQKKKKKLKSDTSIQLKV